MFRDDKLHAPRQRQGLGNQKSTCDKKPLCRHAFQRTLISVGRPKNNIVMASRANPWAALRGLSIRTRSLRSACFEQQQQQMPTSRFLLKTIGAQRSFSDSNDHNTTSTTTSSSSSSSSSSQSQPHSSPPSQSSAPAPGTQVSPYHELFAPNFLNTEAIAALEKAAAEAAAAAAGDGLLFHMPDRAGKHEQLQDRYHPVVHQVTRLLMRDGKLSKAQTVSFKPQVSERRHRLRVNT